MSVKQVALLQSQFTYTAFAALLRAVGADAETTVARLVKTWVKCSLLAISGT